MFAQFTVLYKSGIKDSLHVEPQLKQTISIIIGKWSLALGWLIIYHKEINDNALEQNDKTIHSRTAILVNDLSLRIFKFSSSTNQPAK